MQQMIAKPWVDQTMLLQSQTKTLTVTEAKKRKAGVGLQSRKHQKLLQAEQPKLIECAA